MRVAIVHDWLVAPGVTKHVPRHIIECSPDADLLSLVDFCEDRRPLRGKPVTPSFVQRLPVARRHYRADCDPIITSSHAFANHVLVGCNQTHINYVHSRMRHACDRQHQSLREARLTREPSSAAEFRHTFMAEPTRTIAAARLHSESGGGAGRRRSYEPQVERPAKPASQSS